MTTIGELTERELEILAMVGSGFTNDYIASALWISTNTVKTHLARVARHLKTRDRTHAVTTALHRGLLELDKHPELGVVVRVAQPAAEEAAA